MDEERRELARYQARLLELLGEGVAAEEVRRRLGEEFPGALEGAEDRMVGVAGELVRKWGRRDEVTR